MLLHIALAAASGFFLPLQGLINARTSQILGGPLWPTFINFAGGTVFVVLTALVLRVQPPAAEQFGRVPVYGWLSGLFGMMFVAQAAFTVPKLGAATMMAVVIAGQMAGSILYDQFGVLQSPQPMSWEKIAGVALLLAGVFLILRPDR